MVKRSYSLSTRSRTSNHGLWIDGANLKQATNDRYDGGAFFSPDSKKLVFCASRPQTDEEVGCTTLLAENVVQPTNMEVLFAMMAVACSRLPNWAKPTGALFSPIRRAHPSPPTTIPIATVNSIFSIKLTAAGWSKSPLTIPSMRSPIFSPDGSKIAFSSNRKQRRHPRYQCLVADCGIVPILRPNCSYSRSPMRKKIRGCDDMMIHGQSSILCF